MRTGKKITPVIIALVLLFSLTGTAFAAPPEDNPGKCPPDLEQIVFIHYLDGSHPGQPDKPDKPDKPGKPGGKPEENPEEYYELTKLVLPEVMAVYIIESDYAVNTAVELSFAAWEEVTGPELFDDIYITSTPGIWGVDKNGYNTVSWGDLDTGVIGVTSLWYVPGKPPRTVVEWDIVFNTDYAWGTDGNQTVMDVRNIGTHEVGHVVGLADLYEDKYIKQTMFGISDYGETIKRDLLIGDIYGAQAIYGP